MRITIEIDETAKEPGAATVGIQPSRTATSTASSDAVEVFDGGPAPSGSAARPEKGCFPAATPSESPGYCGAPGRRNSGSRTELVGALGHGIRRIALGGNRGTAGPVPQQIERLRLGQLAETAVTTARGERLGPASRCGDVGGQLDPAGPGKVGQSFEMAHPGRPTCLLPPH